LNCNNGQDNDCSGNVEKWAYTDVDGDRYAPNSTSSCVDVVNFPGRITVGYELGTNDCNDNNASINTNTIWFKDADLDGYYPAGGSQVSCTDLYPENSTYSAIPGGDCNDTDASINPSAPDNTCDSIDNNCNLYVDENTAPCFAPTSFGIFSWGLTYVSLRWTYPSPSSNVEKFVIQRSPNGITYVDVAEAPASATNYTIRTYLTSKYYFRVYAKNATGSGSPSSVTSAPIGVNSLFEKTIGGIGNDEAHSIIQSSDGGYVVAGYTNSFGVSYVDFYVVKLDSAGNVEWTKTIGGSSDDYAYSITQSSDGGYVVVGWTQSFGAGGADMYVVKLGSGGNVQWTKTIGGSDDDFANSVIQSSDGGYVIAGYTQSFGAGGYDMYVVKLDSNGNVVWTKTIGGSNGDVANSIVQSSDGSYVVAGETLSFGASGRDIYVVKLDSSGNIVWTKTIGGSWDDFANSVIQSSDGGYVIAGYTQSFGASWYDIYVVKLDSSGNVIWSKTIGGDNADVAYSIIQSSDGGYIVIGRTQSFGAGGYDVYVVKIDSSGNVLWTKTIGGGSGDEARSITQSSDGGFAIAGYTQSFGAGSYDIYIVKTGPLGDTCWSQGITNYVVSSVSSSFSAPSTVAFPQSPTVTVVSPASGSGGSVSSVCFSAGAPPVPMCLIIGGCDYYQGGSDMQKIAGTMKGVEREKEQNEIKSYGCSAGGVLSRFLIPASVLIIIYGWFRFRKKRKV
jgi:uncharacterized delta-60 repeat protein